MIDKNKKMKLSEIRKYLLAKGFKISKLNKNSKTKELKSLYLTTLFSLILISFFFILPKGYQFSSKIFLTPEEIQNKSKSKFENTIAKKKDDKISKESKVDEGINLKNLFDDIFELEKLPSSSVRLSASTIEQLFKDEKYSLADVRKNKIVKPITIGLLPKEIKKIENTKKRKNLFIKIVLPLILEENKNIKLDRRRLFSIINKSNNSKSEKQWLEKKYKQYGIPSRDLSILKRRMDIVPVSLALAQAAKETGWGTSRFAQEGNNLFGIRTYNKDTPGMKPKNNSNANFKVRSYLTVDDSVANYLLLLNTHHAYKDFRTARSYMSHVDAMDDHALADTLFDYSELGSQYIEMIHVHLNNIQKLLDDLQ